MASTSDTPRASTHNNDVGKPRFAKAYGFAVVTGLFFLLSWFGQFVAQLVVKQNEAAQQGAFEWPQFFAQFLASTFENWQSEFLQLVWQAVGLALLFWGSSQSRESDERIEAKVDRLLEEGGIDPHEVAR
jgi:hypothetical protein